MADFIRGGGRLESFDEYNGNYKISGTITRLGVAGRYRVCCFIRRTQKLLKQTWSGENGYYAFENIANLDNAYFVLAFDSNSTPFNAAIADLVTPEPMP